jgi:DNA repair protein RecN (Recombination protein N)
MEMDFPQGFIAVTGETGAGKSIMLGALGLVLGQRADTSILQDKEKRCVVEAEFSIDDKLKTLFVKNDLDFDEHSIFRREISPNGKSRAFVNDTPVSLSVMKIIGDNLMDIHSQNTTITLKGSEFQMSIVDNYLDDLKVLYDYKALYHQWKNLQKEITELEQKHNEFQNEQSYFQYLVEELDNAALQDGEKETLEEEVEFMANSEEIKSQVVQSLNLLQNDDMPSVLSYLSQMKSNISKVSFLNPQLKDILQRLDSSFVELKDIEADLTNFNENVNFNQQTLDNANERLDLIFRLLKKHNVHSIKELLDIQKNLSDKFLSNEDLAFQIEEKKNENAIVFSQLTNAAKKLTEERKAAAQIIQREVLPLLCDMGMANAMLQIEITTDNEHFSITGVDDIDFLFSANKGSELKPLSKVVSGGELSRLMLALKAVLARQSQMPTIILDEIDNGVSGDIAAKVGNIIRQMAKNHQLIVITHLPQMAAKAVTHYKVFKEEISEITISKIKQLNPNERVEEIAKMLSNDHITQAAINNATELIES